MSAAVVESQTDVVIVQPERMNLLGLMLSGLLQRRLLDAKTARLARRLSGDVSIDASGMRVTLRFEPNRIEITRAPSSRPRARISGTLTALLGAALAENRVRSVLGGRLRAGGDPLFLWRMFSLMRAREHER